MAGIRGRGFIVSPFVFPEQIAAAVGDAELVEIQIRRGGRRWNAVAEIEFAGHKVDAGSVRRGTLGFSARNTEIGARRRDLEVRCRYQGRRLPVHATEIVADIGDAHMAEIAVNGRRLRALFRSQHIAAGRRQGQRRVVRRRWVGVARLPDVVAATGITAGARPGARQLRADDRTCVW